MGRQATTECVQVGIVMEPEQPAVLRMLPPLETMHIDDSADLDDRSAD